MYLFKGGTLHILLLLVFFFVITEFSMLVLREILLIKHNPKFSVPI